MHICVDEIPSDFIFRFEFPEFFYFRHYSIERIMYISLLLFIPYFGTVETSFFLTLIRMEV
jgi:hypothetical protein